MSEIITKNSEILFVYDAKMANPNGDMDNENKPRMDTDTSTNLVSDVRLKRYIRDYFYQVEGKKLFVTNEAEKAEHRVSQILGRTPSKSKPVTPEDMKKLADECYDIRFFGAVLGTTGGNDHLTGAVQFNWGYSLNPVELQETKTITSSFSSGEGIGKDYRVNYSFIAFNGGINAKVADSTHLREDDLKAFDKAMIKAIPLNRTRSKIGQTPRFYLRVQLNSDDITLNDLREYIELKTIDEEFKVENLRKINQCKLNISKLKDYLVKNAGKIDKLVYWKDDNLLIENFEDFLSQFEVEQLKV